MGAKDLTLKPITRADADECIKRWHYSATPYPKSQLFMGVFMGRDLRGALTFGDPLDRRRVLGLVRDTPWEGVTELNRMALDPDLPRNSESRCLGVAVRVLKRHAPHVEWVLSYADATRCGDGAIYRAVGWWLTQIRKNTTMWRLGDEVFSDVGLNSSLGMRSRLAQVASQRLGRSVSSAEVTCVFLRQIGAQPFEGYQLRYICPLKDDVKDRLTCPILPYHMIDELGAGMYKGRALSRSEAVVTHDGQAVQAGPEGFENE